MKLLIKSFVFLIVISTIVGLGKAFSTPLEKVNLEVDSVIEQSDKKIENFESKESQVIAEESKIEEDEIQKKSEEIVRKVGDTDFSSDSKKEETKIIEEQPRKVEETKKMSAWEEIGLTKDEYYNQPIMSWQHVTHSNMDLCKIEGQEAIENEGSDYTTFWCYEVYSPSGNFLGAMLSLS